MKYLSSFIFAVVLMFAGCHRPVLLSPASVVLTPQQKATHLIVVLDDSGSRIGQCTATAVTPNVLMTAEHCIKDGQDVFSKVQIDLSTEDYELIEIGRDGRDHALLILSKPIFRNTVQPEPVAAKVGDEVYMYGSGRGEYPARKLSGVVLDCSDPSDVDEDKGVICFSLPVIPGDSGSMVFDKNDHLVGIITYSFTRKGAKTSVGFRVEPRLFKVTPVEKKKSKKEPFNPFKGMF